VDLGEELGDVLGLGGGQAFFPVAELLLEDVGITLLE